MEWSASCVEAFEYRIDATTVLRPILLKDCGVNDGVVEISPILWRELLISPTREILRYTDKAKRCITEHTV